MEEIKIDLSQFKPTPEELAYIQALIHKSRTEGAVVGASWNQRVYNYLFESGIEGIDLSEIFGCEMIDPEEEEGSVL